MKTIKHYFIPALLCLVMYSCQKEISPETIISNTSTGTLAKDVSGNCLPVTINGIYKKDSTLNATHYIDVSVNVTAAGSYFITTDTINGIYFKDSAAFTATGLQAVRLKGYGKALAAGTVSLTVQYNGLSSCAAQLLVTASGSATATFNLAGAPGTCTTPNILGTYTAGSTLTAANKIQLNIDVLTTGDYSLTTTTVNGFSFTATGTFTITGPQTVTLSGTGKPITDGPTSLSVTGAPVGCSFTVVVVAATTTGTKIKRIIQSYIGSRQAFITSMTYDGSGRLLTFKEWEEDSSFTPIKITGANYSSFTYNGVAEFPVKNIITDETSQVDSTVYTYDIQNRVTKEDWYYNGQVSVRNTYAYLSSTVVLLGKYILTGSPATLQFRGNDSLFFDAQKRITESRSYDPANVYNGYSNYQYDSKNNPFAMIKLFDHVFTLYGDDGKFFYRSPNNLTGFTQASLPSAPTIISVNYTTYNTANYPLTATGSLAGSGPSQNFRFLYEYY